jgi:hypothetical protein
MSLTLSPLRRGAHARAAACAALAALLFVAGCASGPGARIQPPSSAGRPYLSFFAQAGGFDVWIVDGRYVREALDEEFTDCGQHLSFRFIPAREFWIDAENVPGETPFFVRHLLVENGLMARGVPYDDALVKADEAEQRERNASPLGRDGLALRDTGRGAELIARIHKTLLPEYGAGVKVWVVDGELVRDVLFIDFTEGGHDKVYKFIPAGEVWIDDDVVPDERPFVLLHELHERGLMSRGWTYDRAHRHASRLEYRFRRHPGGLDAALLAEIAKNRT